MLRHNVGGVGHYSIDNGQEKNTVKAVILFVEQTNSIIAKNGYSLFVASIVILFLWIGEQIAKIAIFLFVYPFWAMANILTAGAVRPSQNE